MKSSNLAWRIEPPEVPAANALVQSADETPRSGAPPELRVRVRVPPRFDRRTIEIRDQGFSAFRVR
jgi:hypothetical protein